MAQLFVPLFILMLPFIIFFGALALPLRKDQPMETYLAALVSFYLKPRRRLWNPDGTQVFVQITVPKVVEVQRTKNLSTEEAEQRLSYLANIVDSRGWAVRGVGNQTGINSVVASYDESQAPDMMDASSAVGVALDTRLDQASERRHQELLAKVQQPQVAQPQPQPAQTQPAPQLQAQPQQPLPNPYAGLSSTAAQPAADDPSLHVTYNPYPAMQQSVVQPMGSQPPAAAAQPAQKPSEDRVSPDIINLANNPDLSVETIAKEANRIHEKEKLSEDEVVISLR